MDKVIKKLTKLIAHEESARAIGSTAEAAAFAERIQQLLNKHNLSMSEVELHRAEKSAVSMEPVQENFQNIEIWQRALLSNLARINGCYALEHRLGFQCVVGRRCDREIVISLFRYFEKLGLELSDDYLNDRQRVYDGIYAGLWSMLKSDETRRNSFLLGFVATVCQRLEEINRKNIETSDNSAALVFLGNRQTDNKNWIDEHLNVDSPDMEADMKGESAIDKAAFMRGATIGDSVALTDKTLK